ncbi:MAG: ATP synthase F1 subunit epsilon [Candidatus Eiseniibacteriota bacterium]
MATTFTVKLLTPERQVFSGEAIHLYARGTVGYLGVLAHHAPLLTTLEPGVMSIRKPDGVQEHFVVTGGFLEVSDNRATVLADQAEPAGEIDTQAAEAALAQARSRLASPHLGSHGEAEIDRERLAAQAEQAAARLAVWKEYGGGGG